MNLPGSANPRRARGRRAGFTLVELLVSMVVLALIAVLMMSGLRFVLRSMASTDNRREALEELTLGLSVLRGELERAEPLMVKVGKSDLVLFNGQADRLRFANVEPPYLGGPPYLTYEYAIVPDGPTYRIELRRAALDPAAPDLAAVEAIEPGPCYGSARNCISATMGPGKNDPPSWRKAWPPGPKLPLAIRLAEGEDPGWPELVVPLRIEAPWYCGATDGTSTAGCKANGEPEGDSLLKPDDRCPAHHRHAADRRTQAFWGDDAVIGRPRERGAALVVTLIFAAAMAAAAVAFIAGRHTDALALRGQLQGVEAQAMLEAALQQTVTVLNNRESRQRVPSQISWQFGDVTVRVQIASESGKIDLNKAEKPMLQGLAQAVGLPQAAAEAIANSVLDWRDENKAKLAHGAEGRDYRSSDRGTAGTADRPFAHPAELRYVLPVDATAWAALAPFVTVYSGEAEPEASKAAGPVRRAMGIAQQLTNAEIDQSAVGPEQ